MTFKTLAISTLIAAAVLGGAALFVTNRAATREAAAMASHPPSGQFVTINGSKIHYVTKGQGPDVILIHGALGNLRDMTFDLQGKLTDRYRVTAFDRPWFWLFRPAAQWRCQPARPIPNPASRR